jgi:hypothetical protein
MEGAGISRQTVEKTVSQLTMIARSEEACRLLGIDGVLVDQVTITILDDPLEYVAYDIAAAVRDAAEDRAPVQATMLATLVAELRLCGLFVSHIDQHDLVDRVIRLMGELE